MGALPGELPWIKSARVSFGWGTTTYFFEVDAGVDEERLRSELRARRFLDGP